MEEDRPYTIPYLVHQLLKPAQRFFRLKAASSILLLLASTIAVVWANSRFGSHYHHLWHMEVSLFVGSFRLSNSLVHWVNDGLMAIFFFTVGLEIKREVMVGDLSTPKMAALPVMGALGGMIFPGVIYAMFNWGTPNMSGWAIPMATDIAFAIGAVAVFGRSLPSGLRVFLAAFAIADDLGAVLIIALFYSKGFVAHYVLLTLVFTGLLLLANLLWIRSLTIYTLLGIGTWVSVLGSGVHATVAGVIVAMFIPARPRFTSGEFFDRVDRILSRFGERNEVDDYWYTILLNQERLNHVHSLETACNYVETPLQRLEHLLHPWVAFLILPIFALGNAGLTFNGNDVAGSFLHPVTMGIMVGLFIGKPLGVTLFSCISVKMGIAALPEGVTLKHIFGAGMLGGIGFTMALFLGGLSFTSPELLNLAKLGVLSGSVLSACAGLLFLWRLRSAPEKRAAAGWGAEVENGS